MSTFEILEESEEQSRPIELYKVLLGSSEFLWSNSEDEITFMGATYEPQAVVRDPVVSGFGQGDEIKVEVPVTNLFVQKFIGNLPSQKSTLTITQIQRDEPGFANPLVIFKGYVLSVAFAGQRNAVIAAKPIRSFSHTIPRYVYSHLCNHFLYDSQCGVDPAGFTFSSTVSSVNLDGTLDVVDLNTQATNFFAGGYMRATATNEFRLVVSNGGDNVVIDSAFSVDMTGQSVDLVAGCNHSLNGDCTTKFDNTDNYGGYPSIPTRDPTGYNKS